MLRTGLAVLAVSCLSATAMADDDRGFEFRLGATAHDLSDHVEDGPNITADILFPSPDFLAIIWSPRPYVYGSFNTNGLTNFGAAGLAWNWEFAEGWNLEIREGLSYNDGVVDIDPNSPPGDPTRIRLATTRALMGNEILFHTALGLDYDLTETWSVGAYYEHISHGQILASGRNQALDNVGIRFGYRFGQ
ncbi:acyloxyacyl hydrolase [Maricaulis alexandrii]|uniref:acyloxyacyl hydrolase n=1 Tax=Maricaulis alexandrii TaxID=2570354 RepID=UPI001109A686|nr:acyloxyacyl hydrolase [Maricaulis alexandrii]